MDRLCSSAVSGIKPDVSVTRKWVGGGWFEVGSRFTKSPEAMKTCFKNLLLKSWPVTYHCTFRVRIGRSKVVLARR